MSNTPKKPVSKITLFPISAAIWRNETAKGKVFFNFTLERSFKDDAGKWQSTDNFDGADALVVAKLADLVDTEIRKLKAAERQEATSEV